MLPEMIIDCLDSTITQQVEPAFTEYVKRQPTTKWLMFSDYVLGHPGRPNDTFAFSLMPGGVHLDPLNADFAAIATKDLKDTGVVDDSMLRLLADERLFNFCFIVNPSRKIVPNIATLRQMMDQSIAMLESCDGAETHKKVIGQFKAMRNKAASSSFNVRLLENIILATTFAAFLTLLICKQVRAEAVGWFSDRDSITAAHQSIAKWFYGIDVSACCQRLMQGWRGPEILGVCGEAEGGSPLWCDAHLRVADHVAGVVSAWDIEQHTLPANPKYLQVFNEAIVDRPNVSLLQLHFNQQDNEITVSASCVTASRKS